MKLDSGADSKQKQRSRRREEDEVPMSCDIDVMCRQYTHDGNFGMVR